MPRPETEYSYVDEWRSLWEADLEAIAYNGATCDPTRVDPKVLQWAKQNCSRKPHFIKIINTGAAHGRPGLHACQLAVPAPFVKEHFRELERVVALESEGRTWKVSFGEATTYPVWRQGWRRVAVDSDLQPGEVMVFVLVANSRFSFTRFDVDGNIMILGGQRIRAPNSTLAAAQAQVTTRSVTNPQEDQLHRRTSWKVKRAAAWASRNGRCTETDECGEPQPRASALKFADSAPCKRTKVTSSNGESSLATNHEHPRGSEEAGSTSVAECPSTVTIVASHPPQKHI